MAPRGGGRDPPSTTALPPARHWDSQQLRSLAILDVVAECIDSRLAGPLYGFSPSSSTAAIYQVEALIFQLNLMRQDTRSALNAGLPTSLFGTICALMGAILYVFLTRAAAAARRRRGYL